MIAFMRFGFSVLALAFVLSSCGRSESVVDWEVFKSGTAEQVLDEIARLPEDNGLETGNTKGKTPLMWAAHYSVNPEALSVLINAGASLEARVELDFVGDFPPIDGDDGWTPLMLAAGYNTNPEVISVLIKAGAKPDARVVGWCDQDGWNSLLLAARHNPSPEVSSVLIKAGAKLEAVVEGGMRNLPVSDWTPLMLAAAFNANPEVISVLISAGAKLERRGLKGKTPLIWAADFQHNPEVITALLKGGANAKAKDKDGKTALDYAKENEKIYKTKVYWELNDAFHNQ